MFGLKKNKSINQIPSSSSSSQMSGQGMAFRTMQDDLDSFDGKVTLKEERLPEKSAPPGITPKGEISPPVSMAEEKAAIQPKNPSPFLSDISRQEEVSKEEDIAFLSPEGASQANMPEKRDLPWEEKTKLAQSSSSKKGFDRRKILMATLSLVIIIVLGFGGYYFWMARNKARPAESLPEVSKQPQEQPQEPPAEVPEEKFSADKPNFLTIDTESTTAEKIGDILRQKATEVKDSGIAKPIEFVVTDSNNNPIAFHIFATNAGIQLPSALLSDLDEVFSLYYYNDQGNIRLGLAVDLKDKNKLTAEISKEEKTLAKDLNPLFLGNSIDEKQAAFSTGSYKNISIRYVNLDVNETISVDYAVTDKQLIIGTSKNTARVILDKIGQGMEE